MGDGKESISIEQVIIQKCIKCEDELIKKILTICLDRDPIPEDAKRLQKFQLAGQFDSYHLVFDSCKIGTVKIRHWSPFDESATPGYDFIPCDLGELGKPAISEDGTKVLF